MSEPPSSTPHAHAVAASDPRESHILLVDDDDALRKAVARQLSRRGWTVREAATLQDALDVLQNWSADVLITDLRLDKESGLDLLEALPRLSPPTKAILMSGDPQACERHRAFVLGAVRVLTKPVSPTTLDEALHHALALLDRPSER